MSSRELNLKQKLKTIQIYGCTKLSQPLEKEDHWLVGIGPHPRLESMSRKEHGKMNIKGPNASVDRS